MNFTRRVATANDLEQTVALLRAQLEEHGQSPSGDDLEQATRVLLVSPALGRVLLADEQGNAIGLAVLATTWTLERGGLAGWLDELYVAPGRRGIGVGAALLDRAIAMAREMGVRAMEVEVAVDHSRAERLYQ